MVAFCNENINVISSNETNPNGETFTLAHHDYIQRLYTTGKYQITDAFLADADNKTVNDTIAVPILKEGAVKSCVFGAIFQSLLPVLIVKCLLYFLLCLAIAIFGRRYLRRRLSAINHLLNRVTTMQRELFQSEESSDYENLLELTQTGLSDQLTAGYSFRKWTVRHKQKWSGHPLLARPGRPQAYQ